MRTFTISICTYPDCNGWAASHLAEGIGMWHDHGGNRFDFERLEVVAIEDLKETLREAILTEQARKAREE